MLVAYASSVNIVLPKKATNRVDYAAEYLQKKLLQQGFAVSVTKNGKADKNSECKVYLSISKNTASLKKEGFEITTTVKQSKKGAITNISIVGNDGTGCIYACNELAEQIKKNGISKLPSSVKDAPEMVLRGGCIGVQKPYLLPGRMVYEYPYTPELFPWFYDKQHWIEYLDMLVENRMNSVYLWNGHPFASLVKLPDYPYAVEVDDATFEKNKEIFA